MQRWGWLAVGVALMGVCVLLRLETERGIYIEEKLVEELMYFPSGRWVRPLTAGYYNLAGDVVWLRAIQYFGDHNLSDKKFDYLYHIMDVLTTLDMAFVSAYTLGGILLTDYAGQIQNALNLLEKGIKHNWENWRIPFVKGFIYYVYLRDYPKAVLYFRYSSLCPGAPAMPAQFAAFILGKKLRNRDVALALWWEIYNKSETVLEKKAALRNIVELTKEILSGFVEEYKRRHNKLPASISDLVREGFITKRGYLHGPDGGFYYITENGDIEYKEGGGE